MKKLRYCALFNTVVLTLAVLASPGEAQSKAPIKRRSPQAHPSSTVRDNTAETIRLNNLGTAYMNQQQFERALELFRKAYAADPKLTVAQLNEGIALLNLQRYDAAEKVLTTVAQRDPRNAHAWYNLGLLKKAQGDSKSALQNFQRAAELEPKDTDAWYFVGSMFSQSGDEKQAAAAFQKSLDLAPENASAEFGLARAYQRMKDQAQAKAHLARFDQISKTKQGKLMSLAYGDQGLLSLAVQAAGEQAVPAPIQVKFIDVTADSGLPAAGTTASASAPAQPVTSPGACLLDFDGDGRTDILLMQTGSDKLMRLYRNTGGMHFEDVTASSGLNPKSVGFACAAGDYDNDGRTDIAVLTDSGLRLFHNESNGRFADVTQKAGLSQHAPVAMMFADVDHDGDLDLYLVSDTAAPAPPGGAPEANARNVLLRNNGNGTFTDVTAELGLGGEGGNLQATATDVNNDRAIDLVLDGRKPEVLINPREEKWKTEARFEPAVDGAMLGIAVLDYDKDGWMDVAATYSGEPGLVLWHNLQGDKFERVSLPALHMSRAWGVAAVDYDNDGWIDLIAAGEAQDGRGELRAVRNVGPKGFQEVTAQVGLDRISLARPRGVFAADFDGDGDTDLLITQADGRAVLLRNDGGNQNNFLKISLKGLADNKSAIGTKVEIYAGALRQKWEVSPAAFMGQNSTEIIAGLGREKSVDVVRLLWPTGVVQDEAQLPTRTTQKIMELDRRGSSCPLLFAWDGTRYRFVADMIGAGVVGHWISPSEKNTPDPTEYIKLEGMTPALKNGRLSFRLMEPMEEVVYVDQVRLLAVDHPANAEVYPNEYFASNPPSAPFKVIVSRNARPPSGAWDDHGRNVLPRLLERDGKYVTGFEVLPWMGFTKNHSLTLELPEAYQGGPLRLLMNGYIEYFMANSMYAAHQAGVEPFAPYLEAQAADGKWVRVVDDLGFPAGLHRTMTADLTGKLPPGTRRIRLTTNLQIYWDQILVDTTDDTHMNNRVAEVPLASAKLAFHGYSRMTERSTPGDLTFDYEAVSATGPYVRQAGAYTRLGDVTELVSKVDDRFVTFASGDEIQIEFDPSGLPALPEGWSRDYFFFADGFEKDMDFYAAEGTSVAPLPFHAMSKYPYSEPERYPDDADHVRYRLEYNTRFESDSWPKSFQFRYREAVRLSGKEN